MICIYQIVNKINGKKYIGKTTDFKKRMYTHKYAMRKYDTKKSNRHLYASACKYGIENFSFEPIEIFDKLDERELAEAELKWIVYYDTTNRNKGYNLRIDTSDTCVNSEETKTILRKVNLGKNNPNYGKNWTEEMKEHMRKIRLSSSHKYGESWKKKLSEASKEMWKDQKRLDQMREKVRLKKRKYNFEQYTREGTLIKTWDTVQDIISENPSYKWQNIYSVCNGYKKTYMGFVWKKIPMRGDHA